MVTQLELTETCYLNEVSAELLPIVSRLNGSALPRMNFLSHLGGNALQAIHFLGT